MARDPLDVASRRLAGLGVPDSAVAAARERADKVVADAVADAMAAPGPDPASAFSDVWADGGAAWRT